MDALSREINRNFLIRLNDGSGTFLRGAGQYYKIVGEELKNKHFNGALSSTSQKYTIKLRRGLRIDFVSR